MRIILFVLKAVLLFSLLAISTDALARKPLPPTTPISKIEFVGGQLVQENWEQGIWTEYDFRGTRRYNFKKVTYDTDSLRLQGLDGNVQLFIDLNRKTISGEWPSHPMAKLYDITYVEYLKPTSAPKSPIKNQTETVVPVFIPPGKNPPVIKSHIPTSKLGLAEYEGGKFFRADKGKWVEKAVDGTLYKFRNIGRNDSSVFLYDTSRNILIELDVKDEMSRISHSGEKLSDLYPLTRLAKGGSKTPIVKDPTTPLPEQNGKMSAVERTECLTKGGFIERAGMLGFERCTQRYSDGGNICIDSSNCQGKCLATIEAAQGKAVSGQCQATDNPFGCYAEVVAGATGPALCVD